MAPDERRAGAGAEADQAGVEVAGVHAHRGVARLAQRERSGEVPEHALPPERRQQADAGRSRARAVVLEDAAGEGRLAVAVQVVRALARSRPRPAASPHLTNGPTVDDQHVALARPGSASDSGRAASATATSSPPPSSPATSSSLAAERPASTGRRPRRTSASAVRRPVRPVAPNTTIRDIRIDGISHNSMTCHPIGATLLSVDPLLELGMSIKAAQRELERRQNEAMRPLGLTARAGRRAGRHRSGRAAVAERARRPPDRRGRPPEPPGRSPGRGGLRGAPAGDRTTAAASS